VELLDRLAAFARGSPDALGRGKWAPPAAVFDAGLAALRATHGELAAGLDPRRILRLGTRLWSEGRRLRREDDDEGESGERTDVWTPALVASGLEWLGLQGALAARRARWLARIVESTLVWSEPKVEGARLLVIEVGDIARRSSVEPRSDPPVPAGFARSHAERQGGFTVARLDRLRVLTTELKRLVSENHAVAVRLGPRPPLSGERLARVLAWL
jgi:hypothetical protein